MLKINYQLNIDDLTEGLNSLWELSGRKILAIEKEFDHHQGSPVFTVRGKYTSRGWTEWTRGFQYGSALLQFDATGDEKFLEIGRRGTLLHMPTHLTHLGVHDHAFNNLSTYGNLLRLMNEGKIPEELWERNFYELALKVSGAIQASRWSRIPEGGYIYSFNGPHSLFIDTLRTLRILMVSYLLGHQLMVENDEPVNLLDRALRHLSTTVKYSIYYGQNRDQYDIPGRTVHECIFNTQDGSFRNPSSQQGYSGRSTWMRGLGWAILGLAEQLEFIDFLPDDELEKIAGRNETEQALIKALKVTAEYYIENTATDGIPYWDTGAPGLAQLVDCLHQPANPYNEFEPVDSSAAVIAAQGLLRFGKFLEEAGDAEESRKYFQAGLTVTNRLLSEIYLCNNPEHQGLILHSIYHHPNGWDYRPNPIQAPHGEAGMWGDYHARELAIYLLKLQKGEPYYTFYNCIK